nr:rRNA maturation RNase YbeY [Oceanicoccus sagamiensis]
MSVDLQIAIEDEDQPPPAQIQQWVAAALTEAQQANSQQTPELTIRIVDEAEITTLNRDYRHKDKTTNVLSFPADLPDHIDLPLLGDLVICAAVVRHEAIEQHKNINDHWAHMVIHGTLHLLGYDHIDDDEAEIMEGLEIKALASLQIANPYLEINNNAVNL